MKMYEMILKMIEVESIDKNKGACLILEEIEMASLELQEMWKDYNNLAYTKYGEQRLDYSVYRKEEALRVRLAKPR